MKKIILYTLVLISFVVPYAASAKTVQWTTMEQKTFYSLFNFTDDVPGTHYGDPYPLFGFNANLTSGAANNKALLNPSITVTYGASVTNVDTGGVINDGDTVPLGAHVRFSFKPHVSDDIFWFGTGYSADSPYGEWDHSMAPPPLTLVHNEIHHVPHCDQGTFAKGCTEPDREQITIKSIYRATCDANDYVGMGIPIQGGSNYLPVYMPLVVAPPAETMSGTGNLSCGTLAFDSDQNGTLDCTVSQSGSFNPVFNFAPTQGKFYYRVLMTPQVAGSSDNVNTWEATHLMYWIGNSCFGNNVPMTTQAGGTTPYVLAVPAQSISFNFKSGDGINTQTLGSTTLSCPESAVAGQAFSVSITGTDSNNSQIRYGIDWYQSDSVNEWAPASGYVQSGTTQSATHTFMTPGTYQVQALTQNVQGSSSGWSPACNIAVGNTPTTCMEGNFCKGTDMYYHDASCKNETFVQSCAFGCSAGSCVVPANPNGPNATLIGDPPLVKKGGECTLALSAQKVTSCHLTGTGIDVTLPADKNGNIATSTTHSPALFNTTTYTLTCAGAATLVKTVDCKITPTFTEF